jgi:hypothetical protein
MNDYVYIYLDPRKPGIWTYNEYEFSHEPFYVGRGVGNRYRMHLYRAKQKTGLVTKRNLNRIRGILYEGMEPIIEFVKKDISYEESVELEVYTISTIGRKDLEKGPLLNLTDGGEGPNGYVFTEDVKQKIREKVTGDLSPVKGRKRTPEEIKRISEKQIGKFVSDETRKNLREVHKDPAIIAKSMRKKIRSVLEIIAEKGLELNEVTYRSCKRKTDPSYLNTSKYYTSNELDDILKELQSTVRN